MRLIAWTRDSVTEYWARKLSPDLPRTPGAQYEGYSCMEHTWRKYVLSDFPEFCRHFSSDSLMCSPANIIRCFTESKMLEGLALTVAWGGMARTSRYIYARSLSDIEVLLLECYRDISVAESIENAWRLLREELSWSDVMISKSLHFMARSLGFETNPPVPLDNQVIIRRIWPVFNNRIVESRAPSEPPVPAGWRDNDYSWEAYRRYMTAINCWASPRGWTTTQVENSLFG